MTCPSSAGALVAPANKPRNVLWPAAPAHVAGQCPQEANLTLAGAHDLYASRPATCGHEQSSLPKPPLPLCLRARWPSVCIFRLWREPARSALGPWPLD
jgi:hypothetical protein